MFGLIEADVNICFHRGVLILQQKDYSELVRRKSASHYTIF